jgi:hypothetical protein
MQGQWGQTPLKFRPRINSTVQQSMESDPIDPDPIDPYRSLFQEVNVFSSDRFMGSPPLYCQFSRGHRFFYRKCDGGNNFSMRADLWFHQLMVNHTAHIHCGASMGSPSMGSDSIEIPPANQQHRAQINGV